ncbi:SDR family oxidoreductase [Kribbella sp. NBC_00709]|uniref:SDR family NAD(P)-dependent oxidoreductase n=1 Tax=Kribbella sp. NBC_00709 TaxID=2975972 RepID=UPI002E29A4F0|nr:SDR family oxidoreductase [Kribbella sp. NBC_00709]
MKDREGQGRLLDGKVAVVMGAGSIAEGWGNGKATAVTFAREGAAVVCVDVNRDAAEETAAIITSEGGQAFALQADVTSRDDVLAVFDRVAVEHGRIDVLDNNVGIGTLGGVVETSPADWERVLAVNVKSAYLAMQQVIPMMQAAGGGSIVNISSVTSLRYSGIPYVSYASSKAALNQLTKVTAARYAEDNIRVNAVVPGLMKTPMISAHAGVVDAYASGDVEEMWRRRARQVPMGRMGDAWDVANAALFLAGPESRHITGVELVVDGGMTLCWSEPKVDVA